MLRSRKSSNWRTAMVLQELEHEVTTHDRIRPELSRVNVTCRPELLAMPVEEKFRVLPRRSLSE